MNTVAIIAVLALGVYLWSKGILVPSITQSAQNLNSVGTALVQGGGTQAVNLGLANDIVAGSIPIALASINASGLTTGQEIAIGGQAAGVAVGGLAAGGVLASILPASFIPIAGPIIAAIALLATQIFHGANPNQVPASQIEQVYEATQDYLWSLVYKAGMISKPVFIQLSQALIQAAQSAELQARLGTPSIKGGQNAALYMGNFINDAERYQVTVPPIPLDVSLAPEFFPVLPIGPGQWYPNSIAEAKQLTATILQGLAQ